MFKRFSAFIISLIFLVTLIPFGLVKKAYAYQNSSYFNDLKVGLVSMSNTAITVTLNGTYDVNGQSYPSGSVFNLGINGTSIILNGSVYSQINFTPNNQSNLLTITSGATSNKYMGSFIMKVLNSKVFPINTIDMENYLKGVVGYEMSDYYPLEALKAQAVSARNYALSRIGYEAAKGYDFDDTIAYQVYQGYNATYTKVIRAVDETKGQVLLYNDKLVEALYSAWHGGYSEDSENVWGNYVPYLRSAQDTFENDPWPNGNRVFTNAQIQSTLITKKYLSSTDTFVSLDLNSITKYASGRVANINIVYKNSLGATLTKSVTKDNTRTFLSLPSNLYTVTYDSISGAYTFSGRGNGHGLGMSQIGAKNRAAAGQTYDQILKFYFQNSYLQNLIVKAAFNTFTQSSSSLYTGSNISFNSSATAGNGYGYLFKYIVKNGSNTVFTKDYSNTSTLDFIPGAAGNYTIEAYVKDNFSISDFDEKRVLSFTVYDIPVLNSFSIDKTEVFVGQGVTGNIDIQSGSGSYQYKYEVTKDGNLIATRDFSSDKQFTFTPDQAGNYAMTAYVKDSISTNSYDVKQSESFSVYDPVSITSMNLSNTNVFVNDNLNVSTSVSGSSGKGVSYKYIVLKDGQSIFTRDFNTDSQFIYVPTSSGNYEINVYALDTLSNKDYDATANVKFAVLERDTISSLSLDKNMTLVNDAVTINTSGTSVNSLYKFVIVKDGMSLYTKDYDVNSFFQYTPSQPGIYTVEAYAKDSLSQQAYDDVKSINFEVYSPQITSTTASGSFYEEKAVNFSAASTGASPSGLSFKYEIYNGVNLIISSDFSSSNLFSFTPVATGNYTIKVYGKDALSTKSYDSLKQFDIMINSKPLYISKLPLKQGMSGTDVVSLQNALKSLGYSITDASGNFGKQTNNAVIAFQKSKSLSADGIVGPMTYAAINNALIEKSGTKNLTY